jgi:hypothetical protein
LEKEAKTFICCLVVGTGGLKVAFRGGFWAAGLARSGETDLDWCLIAASCGAGGSMYRFDKTRLDLAREFKANPFGAHSPDLQYLLNILRAPGPEPFHVLLIDRPGERWTLAMMEPGRPPRPTNIVFTDLKEAEWHVFRARWAAHAGEELPFE